MAELLLAGDQQRVVLSDLRHRGVSVVHVLAVPESHVSHLARPLPPSPAVQPHQLLAVVQEGLGYQLGPECNDTHHLSHGPNIKTSNYQIPTHTNSNFRLWN